MENYQDTPWDRNLYNRLFFTNPVHKNAITTLIFKELNANNFENVLFFKFITHIMFYKERL